MRKGWKKALFAQGNLMENLSYLFVAYSIIFAAIALYVLFLWRRMARLDGRLRRLEIQLNDIHGEGPDRPKPVITSSRQGA
jgi:CcmD family protein